MVEIIICGARGKMGRAIAAASADFKDIKIVGLVEAPGHPDLGRVVEAGGVSLGVASSFPAVSRAVVIDFSSPQSAAARAAEAAERGFPLVVGTTGLSGEQAGEVEKASKKIPVVMSPNMSLGVNVLWDLVSRAAEVLGGSADVEIIEVHHGGKKDAPSGTALSIARIVREARGGTDRESLVHGRQGTAGERRQGEIGIHAVRGGDIAGDHTVLFALQGERLELTHRAQGREPLAKGALQAALFAAAKAPGLYGMSDVFKTAGSR